MPVFYREKNPSEQYDIKVYVAQYETQADLSICLSTDKWLAQRKDEIWYEENTDKSSADIRIFECNTPNESDLIIFCIQDPKQAKWNNRSHDLFGLLTEFGREETNEKANQPSYLPSITTVIPTSTSTPPSVSSTTTTNNANIYVQGASSNNSKILPVIFAFIVIVLIYLTISSNNDSKKEPIIAKKAETSSKTTVKDTTTSNNITSDTTKPDTSSNIINTIPVQESPTAIAEVDKSQSRQYQAKLSNPSVIKELKVPPVKPVKFNNLGIISTKSGVNVREKPTTQSDKVGKLAMNTPIRILDYNGPKEIIENKKANWCLITDGKIIGWVFGGFISRTSDDSLENRLFESIKTGSGVFIVDLESPDSDSANLAQIVLQFYLNYLLYKKPLISEPYILPQTKQILLLLPYTDIDYNPVIDGQDTPLVWLINSIKTTGLEATVTISKHWGKDISKLEIKCKKINDQWFIDNISNAKETFSKSINTTHKIAILKTNPVYLYDKSLNNHHLSSCSSTHTFYPFVSISTYNKDFYEIKYPSLNGFYEENSDTCYIKSEDLLICDSTRKIKLGGHYLEAYALFARPSKIEQINNNSAILIYSDYDTITYENNKITNWTGFEGFGYCFSE